MNILIKNASVLFFTEENGYIEETSIGIEKGIIKHIGKIPNDFNYEKVIDGKDKLAMPGLINTHTHLPMSLLRNYADDMPLWKWLTEKVWPIENKLTKEDIYWGTMLSIAELIMSGVTCFNDMYTFADTIAKATASTKIRGNISHTLFDKTRNDNLNFKTTRSLYEKWHKSNNDRIRIFIGPHAPYTCSEDYLKVITNLAKELETGIHIHLSESLQEIEHISKTYGKTPVKLLDDIGLFDVRTLAAHCVHLTEEDLDILMKKNVHVLYNPTSNLKLANGFAPIDKMIKRKINISLGTDGSCSNNNLNMFEEINLAAILNKGITKDSTLIPAIEAVKMATINGAKALGIDDKVGSIEIGKCADIILLDLNKPHLYPKYNLISSIVYSAQSSDVDTVIVDGNILMENRKLTTIDLEEVIKHVKLSSKRLIKQMH
ncbi:5-methylthioadenosine/S-adenosylhomocysteine deaminase [Caminicella sporogenes DSM 14501]|uniref:5-methylthioadenosine/S-adenosylhomocysteine deaminase n=1 Tax=Caminicella sporogenes DSM 14501 TaxID=1121266 RepID=A0A1M6RZ83_9FIRM|nr:amidohydrolase [Caminicella sporogenes]RKD27141.1 N-ethylammeline chlorohydrolase [Caminicella sporogenes]SHK37617.1 5-methylthioadenosine/S-adenosylhomocysteine deaminase [Caminicella sporogenes DSM 14501]